VTSGPFCERWRTIPGASRYEVSSCGRVRSNVGPEPRILALAVNHDGYWKLTLMADDGRRWQAYIHRLVMLAFVGEPPPGHVVDHVHWRKSCNYLSQLRYVPEDENRWRWQTDAEARAAGW
jgi:hypothetical protein